MKRLFPSPRDFLVSLGGLPSFCLPGLGLCLGVVFGAAEASAAKIWSTPVGDFLYVEKPYPRAPASPAAEANLPPPAEPLGEAAETKMSTLPTATVGGARETRPPRFRETGSGYLSAGMWPRLRWQRATTPGTTMAAFPDLTPEPGVAPEDVEVASAPEVQVLPTVDNVAAAIAEEASKRVPVTLSVGPRERVSAEAPPIGADEQFINWVTRRVGESKVEIPFELPTGARPSDRRIPSAPVGVRSPDQP